MQKKVLIVSKVATHPVEMGNSKAILAQAQALKEIGCEVDFLLVQEAGLSKGQKEKIEIYYQETKNYWNEHFLSLNVSWIEKSYKNLVSLYRKHCQGNHEGTYDRYPIRLTSYVRKLQTQKHYDICLVQYYYLTKLFKAVRFDKMACFTHDVFAYKNLIVQENVGWIDANQEAKAMQLCSDIFAIQEEEKNYYRILAPQSRVYNVYTPYNYHETPCVGNHNIVFLSGNNVFNQNGLKWFVNEVYPLIREIFQDAKLIIAGGICKVIKDQYADMDGVELIGYMEDPIDLYKMGDVAINPVYQGTGLKIKTFEAISYGKVTLVHPHSMAGIYRKDTAPLLSSDNPKDWIDYLVEIWADSIKILDIKKRNKAYVESMNHFVLEEYKRFLCRS